MERDELTAAVDERAPMANLRSWNAERARTGPGAPRRRQPERWTIHEGWEPLE
jgi:hypothetical protein